MSKKKEKELENALLKEIQFTVEDMKALASSFERDGSHERAYAMRLATILVVSTIKAWRECYE